MKHETKSCPRCGELFECKVGDVLNCQCSQAEVCKETHHFLAQTQYDCLCQGCLSEINQMVLEAQKIPFPVKNNEFIENLHYYSEGGLIVFTEFYHLCRGSCCGNGCRHCAYGNKKSDSRMNRNRF